MSVRVRPDGFVSEEVLYQQLHLPLQVVTQALSHIHPLTRRYRDAPDTVYYGPATIVKVEDWLIDHPEVYDLDIAYPPDSVTVEGYMP